MTAHNSSPESKFIALLQDVAKNKGLLDYEITYNNKSSISGFVGNITKVRIISKNGCLDLVIKNCDSDDKVRTMMPIDLMFKRETYMYETIFPTFRQFEIECGTKPSQFAPTFYMACNNYPYDGDAVVLNDVNSTGFVLYNKPGLLDDDHIQLIITHYANFHSSALAYQDQNPSKFMSLIEPMEIFFEPLYKNSGIIEVLVRQMQDVSAMLDPELHHNAKSVFEKFISEFENFLFSLPSKVDQFSAILHADCWKNNMMFKYSDNVNPTKPTEVCLLDFQISRPGSPMLDVANFLYSCGSETVIDNVQKYLKLYYNCVSNRLHELGCDPEKVYPVSVMETHWQKFARYGLIFRPMSIVVALSDETELKGMTDVVESDGNLSNMFAYNVTDKAKLHKLCTHTILHFVENNLI